MESKVRSASLDFVPVKPDIFTYLGNSHDSSETMFGDRSNTLFLGGEGGVLDRVKRTVPDWIHRRELPSHRRHTVLTRPPPVYVFVNKQLHDADAHSLDEILHESLISEASEHIRKHHAHPTRIDVANDVSDDINLTTGRREGRLYSSTSQPQSTDSGIYTEDSKTNNTWMRRFSQGAISWFSMH